VADWKSRTAELEDLAADYADSSSQSYPDATPHLRITDSGVKTSMSSSPSDCRFSESHEWFRAEGDVVTVGISQFAADELTDITYVELKPAGTTVNAGDSLGEVESVKTTSDVYSVIGGDIIETNQKAIDDPSLLNSDPFGEGWLVKIRTDDTSPLEDLMDQPTYDEKHPVTG
jgi:glycine cleavage system H protein